MVKIFVDYTRSPERRWGVKIDFTKNGLPPEARYFSNPDDACDFVHEWFKKAVNL